MKKLLSIVLLVAVLLGLALSEDKPFTKLVPHTLEDVTFNVFEDYIFEDKGSYFKFLHVIPSMIIGSESTDNYSLDDYMEALVDSYPKYGDASKEIVKTNDVLEKYSIKNLENLKHSTYYGYSKSKSGKDTIVFLAGFEYKKRIYAIDTFYIIQEEKLEKGNKFDYISGVINLTLNTLDKMILN